MARGVGGRGGRGLGMQELPGPPCIRTKVSSGDERHGMTCDGRILRAAVDSYIQEIDSIQQYIQEYYVRRQKRRPLYAVLLYDTAVNITYFFKLDCSTTKSVPAPKNTRYVCVGNLLRYIFPKAALL